MEIKEDKTKIMTTTINRRLDQNVTMVNSNIEAVQEFDSSGLQLSAEKDPRMKAINRTCHKYNNILKLKLVTRSSKLQL